jgi:CheY-like chemotaxis protein
MPMGCAAALKAQQEMALRVFINVVGFSDVERHALNSVFRLSEERDTIYSPWDASAPEQPKLLLLDGASYEAGVDLSLPSNAQLKFIWVGPGAPSGAWRSFERPISWPDVLHAMDELFAPPVDFAIDLDGPETMPPEDEGLPRKRALIASADRAERLYMRARLSLADLTQADDAESGAQALELARDNDYAVAFVDMELPDIPGWDFLKELAGSKRRIPHVIATKDGASIGERVRARWVGLDGLFDKPPDPVRLHELLQKV